MKKRMRRAAAGLLSLVMALSLCPWVPAVEMSSDSAAGRSAVLSDAGEDGEKTVRSEVLLNGESAPGNWTQETNLGDLITDAIVWKVLEENRDEDGNASLTVNGVTVDADHVVGLTNGGGIRASIQPGDVTRKDLNTVLPFGNTVAVVFVTGEELLEALEASTYATPQALGGYPQTSGIRFTLDTTKPYDKGEAYPDSTYYSPASIQRVTIDSINWEDFDPDATYAVVTNNFCAAGGDTYYAFKAASAQFDTGIVMDEAVMEYMEVALDGVITEDQYGEPRGSQVIYPNFYYPENPEDTEAGRTLAELFAQAPDNGPPTVIALRDDAVFSETASVGDTQKVTLNLNGHTLKAAGSAGLEVRDGSLTVTGGGQIVTGGGKDALITLYNGDVTIREAALQATDTACVRVLGQESDRGWATGLRLEEGAELSADFRNTQPGTLSVTAAVAAGGNSSVEMTGGRISVTGGTGVSIWKDSEEIPHLSMTDSVIHVTDCANGMAGILAEDARVTLESGSVVEADGSDPTAIIFSGREHTILSIEEGAVLRAGSETASQACALLVTGNGGSVDGAVVEATARETATAVQVDSGWLWLNTDSLYLGDEEENTAELRVTARVSAGGTADAVRVYAPTKSEAEENQVSVTLGGGTFTGNVYAQRDGQPVENSEILTIMGGLYSVRPAEGYFPEGFLLAPETENGFYRVTDDGKFYTASYTYALGTSRQPYTREGEEVTFTVYDYDYQKFDHWEGQEGLDGVKLEDGEDRGYTTHSITFLMPARDVDLTAVYVDVPREYGGKTIILHSNDVHGEIMGYSYMAGLRDQFEDLGASVILVDAGDFSQGDPNVSLSKGAEAVNMMNRTGYDVATLGNHEFDYGYEQLMDNLSAANFPVICADVYQGDDPNAVIASPNMTIDINDMTIGFVGMETPETQTKVNPGLIQGIRFVSNTGTDNRALYTCAQEAVNSLREDDVDIIIGLTHLGVDEESRPDGHRSVDLYNNTTGFDILLDGHSHTVMTGWVVISDTATGADGFAYNPLDPNAPAVNDAAVLPIQSTGTKFASIGVVVIDNESKAIEDKFLLPTKVTEAMLEANPELERFEQLGVYRDVAEEEADSEERTILETNPLTGAEEKSALVYEMVQDSYVAEAAQEIIDQVNAEYGVTFARSEVLLNGERAPGNRTEETNLGDLITDAIVWKVLEENRDADGDASLSVGAVAVNEAHVVGITNGGGIRASIKQGDVTRKDLNTVLPFGNTVAVVFVTGEELLEALEASTYATPEALGGYPQTFGITFTLDTTKEYDRGDAYPESTYYAPASIQRVTISSINGYPFDPGAIYAVVTNNFCAAGGDTYYAFKAARAQFDTGIVMDEAVMEYVDEKLGGVISAETYGEVRGDQTIVTSGNSDEGTPDESGKTGQGCYVATAVYGSYDCPEVWTLRRFRDETLAETWYGRLFIRAYYAVSPTAVKLFGDNAWFHTFFRDRLDQMVSHLQADGVASTPYQDQAW